MSALQYAVDQANRELGRNADTLKLIERAQEILLRPPTDRQLEVLGLLAGWIQRVGHAPTIRELGQALNNTSTNGTADHLKALRGRGLVTWTPRTARTLAITPAGRRWLEAK